jgi:hypothetical protein
MKNLKTLLTIFLIALFSCESNNEDEKISANLSNDQIVELAESFDVDEESLTDDMDDAFSSFEADFSVNTNVRAKDAGNRTYDSLTGYWTKSIDKPEQTRTITKRRNNHTIIKESTFSVSKTIAIRFSDDSDSSIQFPKRNKDLIVKIEMNRSGEISGTSSVTVKDSTGAIIDTFKETSKHIDKNGSSVLTKIEDKKWMLSGSGEKSIEFTIEKDGETRQLSKSVTTVMTDLIVKHAPNKRRAFGKKVRAQITGGSIERTIVNGDGAVIVILTNYFDCEVDADKRRLTRVITKDGDVIKEVTIYCEEEEE